MTNTIHTIRTNQTQYDNIRDGQRFIAVWNSKEYKVGERIVIRVPGDDYDCGISSRQFLITHVCTHADWPQGVAGSQKIIGFIDIMKNSQPSCDCSSGFGCERCTPTDQLIENMTQFILNDQIMLERMPSREYINNLKKRRIELIARQSAKLSI